MEDPNGSAAAMHLLRRQRHSFLNHFQVISGWLQLDRPDRARQYLDTVAARIARESDAVRRVPPTAGLMMLEVGLEAETHGVEVVWQLESPWEDMPSGAANDIRSALLDRLHAMAGDGPQRQLIVSVRRDGVVVHTPTDEGER